jgi:hypothetical protein
MESTPPKGTLVGAKSRFKWGHTKILLTFVIEFEKRKENRSIITAPIIGWMQVRDAISLSGEEIMWLRADCVCLGPLA